MNISIILFHCLQSMPHSQSQTVVVENPMSVDSSGKLVTIISLLLCLVLEMYFFSIEFLTYS